jgi:hypothetical protein
LASGPAVFCLPDFRAAADPAGETDRLSTQDLMVLLGGNAADLDSSHPFFLLPVRATRSSIHIANQ